MKRTIGLVIQAIIVGYLIIFAVSNTQHTQIKFFVGTAVYDFPLFLLVILVLFVGFVTGVFLMFLSKLSVQSQNNKLAKQIAEYQIEISRLKNITISGSETADLDQNKTKQPTVVNADIKNILR